MKVSIVMAFLLSLAATLAPADDHLGLRVPPGFEVTEFADSKLANDIYCMTLDPQGRVVVSGRGYIRILVDDDGDGRADPGHRLRRRPEGRGAWACSGKATRSTVTGDGGLRRYRDRDGDGRADGPSELIRALKTGGEHAAHAIRRGPDGWLYVLCGNSTGIDRILRQAADLADQGAGRRLRVALHARPQGSRRSSPTASATPTAWTSTPTASCSPSTPTTSAACRCRGTSRPASIMSSPAATTAGRRRSGAVLAAPAVLLRRGRPPSTLGSRLARPASSAIATCSFPSSIAAASSCSTGPLAGSTS